MEPTQEPHFDIWIDENDIINGAKEVVKRLRSAWSSDNLSYKVITDIITNITCTTL